MTQPHHNRGFTLIELALVLTLVGLVLGIFLQAYKIYQQERKATYDRVAQEKITRSMAAYLQVNGHLPCPAASDGIYSDSDFGRAQECKDSPQPVITGAVPVVDLNLPFEMMADAYGNKMTYAVTRDRADADSYPAATDAVTIEDDEGSTKKVPFVIVSHGVDGKGAYPLNARAPSIPCGTTARDTKNCDDDTGYIFADNKFSNTLSINSPNRYDDSITYSLAQKETTLWLISPSATGVNIANRNTGNVGVGVDIPEEKLHVRDGNLHVSSAGVGPTSGNIVINGQLKADTGALIEATDVEAGASIFVKERARAGNKMVAKRYCVDIAVEDCN